MTKFTRKAGKDITGGRTRTYLHNTKDHKIEMTYFLDGMDKPKIGGVLIDVSKNGECISGMISLYLEPSEAMNLAAILIENAIDEDLE